MEVAQYVRVRGLHYVQRKTLRNCIRTDDSSLVSCAVEYHRDAKYRQVEQCYANASIGRITSRQCVVKQSIIHLLARCGLIDAYQYAACFWRNDVMRLANKYIVPIRNEICEQNLIQVMWNRLVLGYFLVLVSMLSVCNSKKYDWKAYRTNKVRCLFLFLVLLFSWSFLRKCCWPRGVVQFLSSLLFVWTLPLFRRSLILSVLVFLLYKHFISCVLRNVNVDVKKYLLRCIVFIELTIVYSLRSLLSLVSLEVHEILSRQAATQRKFNFFLFFLKKALTSIVMCAVF